MVQIELNVYEKERFYYYTVELLVELPDKWIP